jgi:hypothetical protein
MSYRDSIVDILVAINHKAWKTGSTCLFNQWIKGPSDAIARRKLKFLVKFQLQSLVWHESILASVVDIIIEREDRQDIASRMEHRFAVVTNDRDTNGNVGETRFSRPQYRVKVAIIDQSNNDSRSRS